MKRSKTQKRTCFSRLRLQDNVFVPWLLKLRGQLKTDRIGERLVRHDKNIIRLDERQYATHCFANERVPSPDPEQLFRHLLAGERPEPRAGTAGHDDCVHSVLILRMLLKLLARSS